VALVVAILGVIVAWLADQQDRTEYARTEAPPRVTVIVERPDAGEIARIVDERLREREQQADQTVPTAEPDDDLGSHPQERRGTDR
jgi:hypothetical protein